MLLLLLFGFDVLRSIYLASRATTEKRDFPEMEQFNETRVTNDAVWQWDTAKYCVNVWLVALLGDDDCVYVCIISAQNA